MNRREYYSIFKNEPDVLTVPDAVRLLRLGKNTVYKLIKNGTIGSIKQGKKIIIPKTCLIDFLTDERYYQILSPPVPENLWTCAKGCDTVGAARDTQGKTEQNLKQKGA